MHFISGHSREGGRDLKVELARCWEPTQISPQCRDPSAWGSHRGCLSGAVAGRPWGGGRGAWWSPASLHYAPCHLFTYHIGCNQGAGRVGFTCKCEGVWIVFTSAGIYLCVCVCVCVCASGPCIQGSKCWKPKSTRPSVTSVRSQAQLWNIQDDSQKIDPAVSCLESMSSSLCILN